MERAEEPSFDGVERILSVGGVEPGGGIETVLHAMTLLRTEHPRLEYLVVSGSRAGGRGLDPDGGRYRQCIEALADDLGLTTRLRFVDDVLSASDLLGVIAGSHLLAVPSRRIDRTRAGAIGMALSCGRPVVAVRNPVTASMLRDGGGVLVEPDYDEALADAVHVLLDPMARPSVRARRGSPAPAVGTASA